MKAVKYLLIILIGLLVLPFSVWADGEEETTAEQSNIVNVYLFRGEGCPHCQEAEAYFNSLKKEYGKQFRVVDFEVWNNSSNADLMNKVAEARGEEVSGVPYIIIGNMSWNGFNSELGEEMLEQIKGEYELGANNRFDMSQQFPELVPKIVEKNASSDVVALLVILVITGAICFGVYKARNSMSK